MNKTVINIADTFIDIIVASKQKPQFGQVELLADSYNIELGGSGAIFTSQFAKLGGDIICLTIVGDDTSGNIIKKRMNDIGINTEYIQTSKQNKTPLGLNISVNNDRAMLTVLGVLEEITINIITEEIINKARHWHIAGYFLLDNLIPAWPEFLKRIKQKGITCSLDTNWAPNGNWEQVIELFPFIDVFLPNENEAIAITGKSNYQEAGKELSQQIPFVVIKRGADGASVFQKGEEIPILIKEVWSGPINVTDTTGAGDSFDAGFLYEWLNEKDIKTCLKTAILCGTSCVQELGGIKGQYNNK